MPLPVRHGTRKSTLRRDARRLANALSESRSPVAEVRQGFLIRIRAPELNQYESKRKRQPKESCIPFDGSKFGHGCTAFLLVAVRSNNIILAPC